MTVLAVLLLLPTLALDQPSAHADTTSSIAGTVTSEDAAPLPSICVAASASQFAPPTAFAQTDSTGAYLLTLPAGGDYRLQLTNCQGTNYVSQWYSGRSTYATADVVTVGEAEQRSGVDVQLLDGGRITGTVRGAGDAALAGICVSAQQDGRDLGGGTQTDADGSYSLAGLAPGDHRISFMDCRQPAYYVAEYYNDKGYGDADLVTVAANQTTNGIDADLVLGGAIAGTTRDSDGSAVGGICIQPSDASGLPQQGSVSQTWGDVGTYRTAPLPPGNYRVQFGGFCDSDFITEWFNDKSDVGTANTVGVVAGQTTPGVDAQLTRGGSISGQVTSTAGSALSGVCVSATAVGAFISSRFVTSGTDGRYAMRGLPTGDYSVRFRSCGAGNWVGEWYDEAQEAVDATPVAVTAGQATENIDAVLAPGGSVAGTVTNSEGEPLSGMCVSGGGASTQTAADGTYQLDGLPGGPNTIGFFDCLPTSGLYIDEYYDNQPTQDAADPVNVTVGQVTLNINAQLVLGGAIAGRVTSGSGAPVAQACVSAHVGGASVGADLTSSDGTYTLRGLPSGSTKVGFSMATCEPSSWWQNKASMDTADPVTVQQGLTVTGIDGRLDVGSNGQAPTVSVSADPDSGMSPFDSTITLDTSDADGGPLQYTIDFGDGSPQATGTIIEPYTPTQVVRTYSETGSFTVTATVTDDVGNLSVDTTTVGVNAVPAAPAYVQALAGDEQVSLSWPVPSSAGSSPITSYTIDKLQLGSAGTWSSIGTVDVPSTQTTADITDLTNGTTYRFLVHANNAVGAGDRTTSPGVIPRGPTATTLSPANLEIVYGEPATFTATVASTGLDPAAVPTGQVQLLSDGVSLGARMLDATGAAQLSVATTPVGNHLVSARYDGSAAFIGSTSSTSTLAVTQASSVVTVSGSPNPAFEGDPVTIDVLVEGAAPSQARGVGSVTVEVDGQVIATPTLDASGHARVITSELPIGTYTVAATFAGDDNMAGASGSTSQTISGPVESQTFLTAPAKLVEGEAANLSAFVTNHVYPYVATGTITWHDGTRVIGETDLASGASSFTTGPLAHGDHRITASYSGDRHYLASSATKTIIVSRRPEPGGSHPSKSTEGGSGGGGGGGSGGGGGVPGGGPGGFPECTKRGPYSGGVSAHPIIWRCIRGAGPITDIWVSNELNCSFRHAGDLMPAVFQDSCGTLVAAGGVGLYGPTYLTHADGAENRTAVTPVSQTDVTGAGTAADPYRIVTVVELGATGIRLTQTDRYVDGNRHFTTTLDFTNSSDLDRSMLVYRVADCFVSDWDSGYGRYDGPTQAIGCREAVPTGPDGPAPGSHPGQRVLEFVPSAGGTRFDVGRFDGLWSTIGSRTPLGNTIDCDYTDNALGLSWQPAVLAGGSLSVAHRTAFVNRTAGCGDPPPSDAPPPIIPPSDPPGNEQSFGAPGGVETIKYVALGDSYSAGEGIEEFFQGNKHECHRSEKAYPTLVKHPDFSAPLYQLKDDPGSGVEWGFQACSGAETEHVLNTAFHGDPYPQLATDRSHDENPHDLVVDKSTDLVTITIGGNDAGFAAALEFCWKQFDCNSVSMGGNGTYQDQLEAQVGGVRPNVRAVYRAIRGQAPNALVIVLGYPQIFPESAKEMNCTKLRQHDVKHGWPISRRLSQGYSINEQKMFRDLAKKLNGFLEAEVARIGSQQMVFVPVADHFAGHEVCGSKTEWINGLTASWSWDKRNDQSFHPNWRGQKEYARCVNAELFGTGETRERCKLLEF